MSILKSINKKQSNKKGFTIVELTVVIVVIGILAGIAVIGYGSWRQSLAIKAVKSDLEIVKTSMASASNFEETGFPTSVPSSFTPGDNVEVTYISGDAAKYCIEGKSKTIDTILWHVEGKIGSATVIEGACPFVDGWKDLASSNTGSCAVSASNSVYCWGASVATPTLLARGDIPVNATISAITAGTNHYCVVANEWAYCWGTNSDGRLGDGTVVAKTTPKAVLRGVIPAAKKLADISAGSNHTCTLTTDSLVYCWGYGAYGQLGRNSIANSSTPIAIVQGGMPAGAAVSAISAGGYNTCAIVSGGWVYCWGTNNDGEAGNGTNSQVNFPTAVSSGDIQGSSTIATVSVGSNHSCVLSNTGLAYCWGAGFSGRLGNGDSYDSNVPVVVAQGSEPFTKLSIGVGDTCAVTASGGGYCWGVNGNGQLGGGSSYASSPYVNTPIYVLNGSKPSTVGFTAIKPGDTHVCALASSKKIYCWGSAVDGKLGNGESTGNKSTPVATIEVFS